MATQLPTAIPISLVRSAGVDLVLFRLHEQGMLASASPVGSPTTDVVVLSADETVIATMRIKTRTRGDDKGWRLNVANERIRAPRAFYAFVDLDVRQHEMPTIYVIPSGDVADALIASHKAWLAIPNHHDTRMRTVKPAYGFKVPGYPDGWMERYREAWSPLKTTLDHGLEPINNGEFGGTTYAPALLPTPSGT